MVIVNPDGSLTLESGDPDFQSIIIGNPDPQNDILDPDPTKPVSQLVLETFNIPFTLPVLGGELPGFDIKNQDPITMLKLSLATELLDPPDGEAGFAEIELDEFGIARFYVVGVNQAINLDIRYCIPTSQVVTPADLVIVRGYDPPPERQLRTSFDGLKNAEIMEYEECAAGSCDERAVAKFATISYDDPLLDQVYLDDVVNSYELKAFESLIGYIVDLDLPDGADRDDDNFIPGLKITFGDTTKEYIKTSADLLNNFVTIGTTAPGGPGSVGGQFSGVGPSASFGPGADITSANLGFGSANGGGGSITVNVTEVDPQTGECTQSNASIAGSKIFLPASRFERLNKFGRNESDFVGVTDVIFSGRKVITFTIFGDIVLDIFVRTQKELVSLSHGKNWVWDVDENGDVTVQLFSILEDDFTASVCDIYQNGAGTDAILLHDTAAPNLVEAQGSEALKGLICNVGDRLGYKALDNRICIVVERKRPSVDIFVPAVSSTSAGDIARQFIDPNGPFGITYTPIVIIDVPAPITYAATSSLTSIDGTRTIAAEGIIDQADGIVDADPSTTQDLEDSELAVLQDNTNGSTIDISLPFCTDTECLQIARNFLALQNQTVTTQSIILGPDSQPELGQIMPDGAVINEINYSYSDASQYLITITTGPLYLTSGSFNSTQYQLRTEDVTREGVVMQDAGNGAEYVVRVEGFGEITALSMILDEIAVGDKVSVRIFNNPVERI